MYSSERVIDDGMQRLVYQRLLELLPSSPVERHQNCLAAHLESEILHSISQLDVLGCKRILHWIESFQRLDISERGIIILITQLYLNIQFTKDLLRQPSTFQCGNKQYVSPGLPESGPIMP